MVDTSHKRQAGSQPTNVHRRERTHAKCDKSAQRTAMQRGHPPSQRLLPHVMPHQRSRVDGGIEPACLFTLCIKLDQQVLKGERHACATTSAPAKCGSFQDQQHKQRCLLVHHKCYSGADWPCLQLCRWEHVMYTDKLRAGGCRPEPAPGSLVPVVINAAEVRPPEARAFDECPTLATDMQPTYCTPNAKHTPVSNRHMQ